MAQPSIIFFGSPNFSAEVLLKLHAAFSVVLVVTQPDTPSGRQQIIQPTMAAKTAAELGIPLIKPENIKTSEIAAEIAGYNPDLFVVIAYGKIIPKNILAIPRQGAINIHPSLLPELRGPSPIHFALLQGKNKTGVSFMVMDELMDHGPILLQKEIAIDAFDTEPTLESKLITLACADINQVLADYLAGSLTAVPQAHMLATFSKIITKKDGQINWKEPAIKIYNAYRAFVRWPGIWTTWQNRHIKINACALSYYDSGNAPGTLFLESNRLFVHAGSGSIEIIEIQMAGKKSMPAADFMRGQKSLIGSQFD